MPCPLGQRALCSFVSGRGHSKIQSLEIRHRVELQICARTAAQLTRPLRRRFEKPECLLLQGLRGF